MLNLINMGPKAAKGYCRKKNVYVFGAGRALKSCLEIYFKNCKVVGIIDNNKSLLGNKVKFEASEIEIHDVKWLREVINKNGTDDSVLMITSPFYAAEIVEDLDKYEELNGLDCLLQVIVRLTKEDMPEYQFTQGKEIIPRKIHYIWIGDRPLPEEFQKNIDTWKKNNPDYEIIKWNEDNYDFNKSRYLREAYSHKRWEFASNYARLDIVYNNGGIYLDTDVEAIASFDRLLNDRLFMCMGTTDRMNHGCGFGSAQGCSELKDITKLMDEEGFLDTEGKPTMKHMHPYLHDIYKKMGFKIENRYQKKDGAVLYPNEVMSPLTMPGLSDFISDKTVSIHKEAGSWQKESEKKGTEKLEQLVRSGRIS